MYSGVIEARVGGSAAWKKVTDAGDGEAPRRVEIVPTRVLERVIGLGGGGGGTLPKPTASRLCVTCTS